MVLNRGDIKRKRKVNNCINLLDDSPKRTKVHAQRKFAQGSNVSSPVITPVKEIEKQERSRDILPEPAELLPIKRPNTEDFLTFLCFRGTPILPTSLNFFNTASMIDTRVQTDEPKHPSPKNGPIVTHSFNKSQNERPFIAFGVRKRADPIVISKQMDKKRRHALTLQALRRKYQEQKMAKIRAVTISKLSEKITSKSVVRTRSVTKNETITKKNVTQKTNIKVVATKRITRTTIKQPISSKIKSKMCLRSFRGRYIHHELGVRKHKKKPFPKKVVKTSEEKKIDEQNDSTSSEFSSDDDEPLVKTAKVKSPGKCAMPRTAKKSAPGPKKPSEINYRLTRSHRILLNNQLSTRKQVMKHKRFFPKPSAVSTKILSKKILQSSRILKKRLGKQNVKQLDSVRNEKVQEKKISKLTNKSVKPIVIESSERIQTRSEPKGVKVEEKNERNLKQYLKIGKSKGVNDEETSKIKDKCIMKKGVCGKSENRNEKCEKEEPKKFVKEKVEAVEVKNEKQISKSSKKTDENEKLALKKVAVVKISKEECEKTDDSEKQLAKKLELQKIGKEKCEKAKETDVGITKKTEILNIDCEKGKKTDDVGKVLPRKSEVRKISKDESESQVLLKADKKENEKTEDVDRQSQKKLGVLQGSKENDEKQEERKIGKEILNVKKGNKEKNEKADEKKVSKEKIEKVCEKKVTEEKNDKCDEKKVCKERKEKTDDKLSIKKDKVVVNEKLDKIKPVEPIEKHVEKSSKAEEVQKLEKVAATKRSEKSRKSEDSRTKSQEKKSEPATFNTRPTRKTKEAAAIYMEILGHKLVNDAEIDDDDISIDSFPELPNVRKTEQRENELKARAKSKANETKELVGKKTKPTDKSSQGKVLRPVESAIPDTGKTVDYKNKEKFVDKVKNQNCDSGINSKSESSANVSPSIEIHDGKITDKQNLVTPENVVDDRKDVLGKRKSSQNFDEKSASDSDENLQRQKVPRKSSLSGQDKLPSKKNVVNVKNEPVDIEKRQTRFHAAKPFLDMSFSDSDESFTIDMKICGTVETKQKRKKVSLSLKKPAGTKSISTDRNQVESNLVKTDLEGNEPSQISVTNLKAHTPEIVVTDVQESIKNAKKYVKPVLRDNEDKSFDDTDSSVEVKTERNKKKTKTIRTKKQPNHSFSDSDEEPLSKLTQLKTKKDEQSANSSKPTNMKKPFGDGKTEVQSKLQKGKTIKEKTEKLEETLYANKPKRECTKRAQSYLPLFSSSDDEEKYFHGFVKSETKTLKHIKNEDETCMHALSTSDLLCKDVGRRFGKGKVNMSNEQIEKWLNDSAMAGINIKKENDEMLKFGEKIPMETSLDAHVESIDTDKLKCSLLPKTEESPKGDINVKMKSREQLSSGSTNSTPDKQIVDKPVVKPVQNERKTIFRKERCEPVRNINAFSASNESSVYAFQAENEDSISTPFRRPSRRPSSTATSKSEDDVSKLDENSKNSGKFRLPSLVKTDPKSTSKQEVSLTLSTDDSNSASIAVQVNLEPTETFIDNSNAETQVDAESNEQMFYIPLPSGKQASSQGIIQGVSIKMGTEGKCGTNQRLVMRAKLVTQSPFGAQKLEDKSPVCSASMFPPANTLQKSKPEGVKCQYKWSSNKSSDRLSETSEDFKYKVPSSPSASSSSSAKLYKRQKARCRPLELCTPVQVTDFPSVHCLAQMVEAPVFYPTEKEFQDPLEYIEKIRMKANKFGICRIVPPSNFKPECKVADDMRFTAYNQYVHKMLHRWGPNFKELMAIKKYLQTQNISLTHPPWIGGMEIDLPRLYQTVQLLGGLKEVIEKKKWPKVSEAMKIPKSAQDRVTKLDDIYCKYLLPYDTLSPAEREKLFDEVETEWAKRESKTLLKVQQKVSKNETGSESESDPDDESEECIVKGRNMALNAFYRIARNTMSMWFKTTEPPAQEVEQEFWKHVALKNNHICVHSGSIDSGNWGYGFAVSKNSPFARHAWNLKVLTNNSGSVLRSMGPLMGVTVPTLHVGMVFSACCWYRDPHSLPWIEYLHTGANKIWYGIPDSMSEYFHTTLLKLVPNYCKNKSLWLPSDTVMIPPNLLVENGVSLSRTVQEPGQFIVVFPKVFTSSISTGYVVSESVYFAPPYWLERAQTTFDEMKTSCEPSMFSLDRLILSISTDPRSNVDVLRQIIPAVQHICDRERNLRAQLSKVGLNLREKLPLPEAPAIRKRKKLQDDNGDFECEICRTNLFISLVAESQEDVVYCLEHAASQLETKKIEVTNCKLMFTYDDEELGILVEKIKSAIDVKLQKKLPGKYAGLPTLLK